MQTAGHFVGIIFWPISIFFLRIDPYSVFQNKSIFWFYSIKNPSNRRKMVKVQTH